MSPSIRRSDTTITSCSDSLPALSTTYTDSISSASIRTSSSRNVEDLLMPITVDPDREWMNFALNRQRRAMKRDMFNNRFVDWKALPVLDDSEYEWSQLRATPRLRCDASARYFTEILTRANDHHHAATGSPPKSNKLHSNFFAKGRRMQKSGIWNLVKHALPDRVLHHKNSREQCTISVILDDEDEAVIDMIG